MPLLELLTGKGGTEVGVVLADQGHGPLQNLRRSPPIRWAPALLAQQTRVALVLQAPFQALHLSHRDSQSRRGTSLVELARHHLRHHLAAQYILYCHLDHYPILPLDPS